LPTEQADNEFVRDFAMGMTVPTRLKVMAAAGFATALLAAPAAGQQAPVKPVVDPDGTTHVSAFELPASPYLSDEALAVQRGLARGRAFASPLALDIATARLLVDEGQAPRVKTTSELYPADMVEQVIAGVPVRIFTPAGKAADPTRVLINLHGGAFRVCWDACSRIESQPIAALGTYKVVSINYRMAPEARHPAAVEDTAMVYRELLKTYAPGRIGVFGCSAGGILAAQLAAWLPQRGLPQIGAIGIFGAGAVPIGTGDSAWISAYVDGSFPPPAKAGEVWDPVSSYFSPQDLDDPLVSAAKHPEIMAKFPPTLIITGTRAMDMSPAVYANSQLIKARVQSTLIVGEGLGHCYINHAQLPESQDAYAAMVDFFRQNLR
jgi:epsilon-lactone hydrolase